MLGSHGRGLLRLALSRAWLVAVVAAIGAAVFTAWFVSLQPPRSAVEVLVPPLPDERTPGRGPIANARDAALTVETVAVFKLDASPHDLSQRIDAEFDPNTRLLEITVTRFANVADIAVANRLGQRVLERWNERLATTRRAYDAAQRRRNELVRATDRLRSRLGDANDGAAGPMLTGLAAAEAEIARMNARLLELGPRNSAEAFVYRPAERESAWTPPVVAAGAVVGVIVGVIIALLALVYYDRRRRRQQPA